MSRKRLPLLFRVTELLFDGFLARIRILLWPFRAITFCWSILVRILWMLSNEYSKRTFGTCGHGVRIHGRFHVTAPRCLHIGNNVHINTNAFLRAEGGLYIGDNTHISRNLVIYTMNHNYRGELLPYDAEKVLKPVHIGRNVWIGMNVTIVPGITIGDGAIIGMGTCVARDVPAMAIVGSAPQRVLKERNHLHYNLLDEAKSYSGMSGYPITEMHQR